MSNRKKEKILPHNYTLRIITMSTTEPKCPVMMNEQQNMIYMYNGL